MNEQIGNAVAWWMLSMAAICLVLIIANFIEWITRPKEKQ